MPWHETCATLLLLSNGKLFSVTFCNAEFILDLAICKAVKQPTEASSNIISFWSFVLSKPLFSAVPSTIAWEE